MTARTALARSPRRTALVAVLAAALWLTAALLPLAAFAPGGNAASAETAFDIARVLESVVTVETYDGQGSGLVVTAEGHVLTNAHVLDGQKSATIYFGDGVYKGKAVLVDEELDLAVLSTDIEDAVPAEFAETETIRAGMEAFAVGSPEGLPRTVTRGIVSVVGQPYYGQLFLQTDASITYGNSGGPLCGADGKVLGLVAFSLGGGEELGFAIPNDTILSFLHRAGLLMARDVAPLEGIEGIPGYYDGTSEGEEEPPPDEGGGEFFGNPDVTVALLVLSVAEAVAIVVLAAAAIVLMVRLIRKGKNA